MKGEKFKILIIDDHEVVRFGISQIIRQYIPNSEIHEKNEIGELNTFIKNGAKPFNLIISDLNLPDHKFYQVIDKLTSIFNSIPIIIFSMYDKETVLPIIQNKNIFRFIHKGDGLFSLKDTVLEVYNGSSLNYSKFSNGKSGTNKFSQLSPREMEIAIHLISGKTGTEIQEITQLRATTISTLKYRIFNKLEISNIADLMKMSLMYGIDQG